MRLPDESFRAYALEPSVALLLLLRWTGSLSRCSRHGGASLPSPPALWHSPAMSLDVMGQPGWLQLCKGPGRDGWVQVRYRCGKDSRLAGRPWCLRPCEQKHWCPEQAWRGPVRRCVEMFKMQQTGSLQTRAGSQPWICGLPAVAGLPVKPRWVPRIRWNVGPGPSPAPSRCFIISTQKSASRTCSQGSSESGWIYHVLCPLWRRLIVLSPWPPLLPLHPAFHQFQGLLPCFRPQTTPSPTHVLCTQLPIRRW